MSDAPEGFLDSFNDGGSGVLDPLDGVLVLKGGGKKIKGWDQRFEM